ncbi:MAG: glycerate kinase type-2 family protein [Nitrososphaeria archaeon]
MFIRNADEIAISERSRIVLELLEEALSAADPFERMAEAARSIGIDERERTVVIAVGKAAPRMFPPFRGMARTAFAASNVKLEGGLEAGHPFPDFNSYDAARIISSLLRNMGRNERVVFLISGGASSIVGDFVVSPWRIREVTRSLMNSGADIHELNAVRKHVSYLKGGRAVSITEARIDAYIVSDVVDNDLSTIASGLTAPDPTTFADALEVMRRHDVHDEVVCEILQSPERYGVHESVKPSEFPYERVRNTIVASNADALKAVERRARLMGLKAKNLGTVIRGEAREEAVRLYRELERMPRGSVLVAGGESVVTVRGRGRGGRNQELVLSLVKLLREGEVAAAVGTDGIDGPTDAAGAVADWTTRERAERLGLDPDAFLMDNDSYTFFSRTGGLIRTGPTGTNVMDVVIMLKL